MNNDYISGLESWMFPAFQNKNLIQFRNIGVYFSELQILSIHYSLYCIPSNKYSFLIVNF